MTVCISVRERFGKLQVSRPRRRQAHELVKSIYQVSSLFELREEKRNARMQSHMNLHKPYAWKQSYHQPQVAAVRHVVVRFIDNILNTLRRSIHCQIC